MDWINKKEKDNLEPCEVDDCDFKSTPHGIKIHNGLQHNDDYNRCRKKTDLVVTKLEYAVSQGANITERCDFAGISRKTYYRWVENDEKLRNKIEALEKEPVMIARANLIKSIKKGSVRNAKWLLERIRADEFSTTQKQINETDREAVKAIEEIQNFIQGEENQDESEQQEKKDISQDNGEAVRD